MQIALFSGYLTENLLANEKCSVIFKRISNNPFEKNLSHINKRCAYPGHPGDIGPGGHVLVRE